MNDAPSIEIRVSNPALVDDALNAAVMELQIEAARSKRGILVTRTAPGQYVASVSHEIPFGLSREAMA